jgi:hypothetical protein
VSPCSTLLEDPLELSTGLERLWESLLSSSDTKYTRRWPDGTYYGCDKYEFSSVTADTHMRKRERVQMQVTHERERESRRGPSRVQRSWLPDEISTFFELKNKVKEPEVHVLHQHCT